MSEKLERRKGEGARRANELRLDCVREGDGFLFVATDEIGRIRADVKYSSNGPEAWIDFVTHLRRTGAARVRDVLVVDQGVATATRSFVNFCRRQGLRLRIRALAKSS